MDGIEPDIVLCFGFAGADMMVGVVSKLWLNYSRAIYIPYAD
jgi:hypothetical protein